MGTSLHFTSLHFTLLHFTLLHFTSLYFTSLYFTLLYFTLLHFTSLYFTLLHFTSLYFTFLSFSLTFINILFTSLKSFKVACFCFFAKFNAYIDKSGLAFVANQLSFPTYFRRVRISSRSNCSEDLSSLISMSSKLFAYSFMDSSILPSSIFSMSIPVNLNLPSSTFDISKVLLTSFVTVSRNSTFFPCK